jgi:hypothetical protein
MSYSIPSHSVYSGERFNGTVNRATSASLSVTHFSPHLHRNSTEERNIKTWKQIISNIVKLKSSCNAKLVGSFNGNEDSLVQSSARLLV